MELLAEDAVETLEDKPAFPAKELLPAKVSGKKGAAVTRPRKNPEKKNRKGDTAPVADDAAPADADTAEDTVKYTKTAAEETPPDSTDSNLQADTEDGLPWEEDTGQKEAAALTADNQLKSAPTDQSATTIPLYEAKNYLRVDSSDEDALVGVLLLSAEQLCVDVARLSNEQWKVIDALACDGEGSILPTDTDLYTEEELSQVRSIMRVAILYAFGYLYEHREEADHHALLLTLRSLLFAVREGVNF